MDYVKGINQKKSQDLFTTTIEDVQNARYTIITQPQYVLAVRVLPDQNHTIQETEKHIIISQYI